jgi:nicotinamidase-related amidase
MGKRALKDEQGNNENVNSRITGAISLHTNERRRTMQFDQKDTAVVVTDPQNDFLSEKGVTWQLVGDSVKENKTIENIERLFQAAKKNGFEVFVSPHYYYPTDRGWQFGGTIENVMHEIKMFDRSSPLSLEGFSGSGADWLERFKPYIEDGKTVVAGPHKVYGPENNDLVLQLRKRNINKVVLAGMSANLCVEAHLRELLEQGFEVAVVKDATAGARHPELGDGYAAAMVNFGFLAGAVLSTDEAVQAMG